MIHPNLCKRVEALADSASVAETTDAGSGAPETTHSDISNDMKTEHV